MSLIEFFSLVEHSSCFAKLCSGAVLPVSSWEAKEWAKASLQPGRFTINGAPRFTQLHSGQVIIGTSADGGTEVTP